MIRSGELRHIAEVLKPVNAKSDSGATTQEWELVARAPVKVMAIGSSQGVQSDQVKQTTQYQIKMRWLTGIDATYRLRVFHYVPGGAILMKINGVNDPEGMRAELLIDAVQIKESAN